MLAAAQRSGVAISEVQLDYDCPERLLRRWSAVTAILSRGVLAGRRVWITSLISHVRHAEYGDLFRANVAGHILQLFDTGDRMSLPHARQIERLCVTPPHAVSSGCRRVRATSGERTDDRP